MKISFDLDETITKDENSFYSIIKILQESGNSVGCLTVRYLEQVPNIGWDFIICLNEEELKKAQQFNPKSEEDVIRTWKSKKIIENEIDIHFDDMADFFSKEAKEKSKIVKV